MAAKDDGKSEIVFGEASGGRSRDGLPRQNGVLAKAAGGSIGQLAHTVATRATGTRAWANGNRKRQQTAWFVVANLLAATRTTTPRTPKRRT